MRYLRTPVRAMTPLIVMLSLLILPAMMCMAASSGEETSVGRSMARQATKNQSKWITTDHSKHEILQQEFKSGAEVTEACISCHSEAEHQFNQTIHWTWRADPNEKENQHGKVGNSLNNFCISTNAGEDKGCLSCHTGWGKTLDTRVNCLVCHSDKKMNFDEAVTDIKAFLSEGDEDSIEIAAEIQSELSEAAQSIILPGRENCGSCHFFGGGGDGVKHGDLDSSLSKPSKTLDVHMGTDGQDFTCARCHSTSEHNISGRVYTQPAAMDRKSLVEDDLTSKITCESCHTATPHESGSKLNDHTDKVACQSCHIPEFARINPTKMSWDWSQAGRLEDGKKIKTKDEFGKDDYLTIKGQMNWEKHVKPEYFWYNGSIDSVTVKTKIDPLNGVKVSWPVGAQDDPDSRIYPFKVHHGVQPYDSVNNTLLAPLLSGPKGYWNTLNWEEALTIGQNALNVPFSGQFDFVPTTYVFPITHMVAPKEDSLNCVDCHTDDNSRLENLAGFYMPGRDSSGPIHTLGWILVFASLAGVLTHGIGKAVANRKKGNGHQEARMTNIYLYGRFERFWHWLQMATIVILLLSGLEIHSLYSLFGFKDAVSLHNFLGLAWLFSFFFFVFWMVITGEWRQYIPTTKKMVSVIRYYMYGIFKGETHPVTKKKDAKYNPLQRLIYLILAAVLLPVQMVTGFLYWGYNEWTTWGLPFLSLQVVALLHLAGAIAILSFVIVHVYMTTTGHTFFSHIRAMITGWEKVDDKVQLEDWERKANKR